MKKENTAIRLKTIMNMRGLRKCNGMVGAYIGTKDEWNVFMEADRYL